MTSELGINLKFDDQATNNSESIDKFKFSKALLYVIDSSIYHAQDTVWSFSDGEQAYKFAFQGGAFVDSNGNPVHNRYRKIDLTTAQMAQLRESFFVRPSAHEHLNCIPMYRDVLVLEDSAGSMVGQIQICFGCGVIAVHPGHNFNCVYKESLDFQEFRSFVDQIKSSSSSLSL